MKIKNKKMRLKLACWGIVFTSLFAAFSAASAQPLELIQTGRYLTINSQPKSEQADLLSPIIQVHFLSDVKTVGDAIHHLLRYSGYSLVESKQQSPDLQNTLQKPLPLVDRDLGPVSLRQALGLLIGPAFDLVADPLNRTINFQLKLKFSHAN